MQKTIEFDALTAADVKTRLQEFNSIKNYLNAVMLTAARMAGADPTSTVDFLPDGSGIVINTPENGSEDLVMETAPAESTKAPERPAEKQRR